MKKYLLLLLMLPLQMACAKQVGLWDVTDLYETPKFEESALLNKPGCKSLFYEGLVYKGVQTKVFAYYGVPKGTPPKGGWPAVVCVHGGGGTAFEKWVEIWNTNGFAAISMDLEGHLPDSKKHTDRSTFPESGPKRVGVFHDYKTPQKDQWYYHAVAQVILGHSLIGSFPEVNADKVGMVGVSWGGMLSSAIAGIDDRFKFAIPSYGCGYLIGTDGHMGKSYKTGGAYLENLKTHYESSNYIPNIRIPALFVNGTHDAHFPIPATNDSVLNSKPYSSALLIHKFPHGHGPIWQLPEVYDFAKSVITGKEPQIDLESPVVDGGEITVDYKANGYAITKTELYYTVDNGEWIKRNWIVTDGEYDKQNIKATIPVDAAAAFFSIVQSGGMRRTSPVWILK